MQIDYPVLIFSIVNLVLIASSWADLRRQVQEVRDDVSQLGDKLEAVENRAIRNSENIAGLQAAKA